VDSTPPSDDVGTGILEQIPKACIPIDILSVPSQPVDAPLDEQQIARNVQALKNRLRGRGGRGGGRGVRRTDSGNGRDTHPDSE
jgi:signal recognition particle receptor subunit alpha